jgi:hypothetical protein
MVLDHPDRSTEALTLRELGAAADIELLDGLDQLEAVTLTGVADTLRLFGRRHERFTFAAADTADPDNTDRTTRGGPLGS